MLRDPKKQSRGPGLGHYRPCPAEGTPPSAPGAPLVLVPLVFLLAAPSPDLWEGTLEEARALSAADGKPILLLFPSGRAGEASPVLEEKASLRRALSRFHLARARSIGLQDLLSAYQVNRVPALLLLDRHRGLWERWEAPVPGDLWAQVERSGNRLRALEEESSKALAASRAALLRKDFAGALACVRKVRDRARAGYPEPAAAAEVEAGVLARAGEEVRRALAREGIARDEDLLADLKRLRSTFPHPDVESLIDRETGRLRSRSIGGSRKTGEGG